ncbi:MAG: Lrp/AsnC family transcriptional regulator [Thermoplasmatales archaeon]|nr:Lrp/AsnC family transcriptional regulator [Thermoplasmatales archaeon]
MAKSKKEISSNARKILDAIEGNAWQSSIEISEKTGLSRQTVQKTIRKLEKEHVIWGYQVIVDEEKKGFSNYLVLIKRTIKPIDENLADKIISRKIEETASNIGVIIVTSLYCHGSYDWIISFMATDIRHAKRFTEQVKTTYSEYIADVQLLDILFFVKKQGFLNPDIDKLKEFV